MRSQCAILQLITRCAEVSMLNRAGRKFEPSLPCPPKVGTRRTVESVADSEDGQFLLTTHSSFYITSKSQWCVECIYGGDIEAMLIVDSAHFHRHQRRVSSIACSLRDRLSSSELLEEVVKQEEGNEQENGYADMWDGTCALAIQVKRSLSQLRTSVSDLRSRRERCVAGLTMEGRQVKGTS